MAILNLDQIKDAITKLPPEQARELSTWFEEQQRTIATSDILFRMYDEEEGECRSRVAEKSG